MVPVSLVLGRTVTDTAHRGLGPALPPDAGSSGNGAPGYRPGQGFTFSLETASSFWTPAASSAPPASCPLQGRLRDPSGSPHGLC